MPKDEEHIIDWIIKKTDLKKQSDLFNKRKRDNYFENRKIKLDNQIFLCKTCNHTWSKVPKSLDSSGWRMYPKENMPTIGKKRKKCINCRSKNGKP